MSVIPETRRRTTRSYLKVFEGELERKLFEKFPLEILEETK
jgi:hypothetical protein